MSESKIQIKVGHVEFSGEGSSEWLSAQLDKILEKVPDLLKIELANGVANSGNGNGTGAKTANGGAGKPTVNYATWLKDKNATTNQTRKFLASAAFIQLGGKERMSTSDITGILKQYSQNKLGNASESLNQNVSKGHCEKDGNKSFYVTPEGFKELGIAD